MTFRSYSVSATEPLPHAASAGSADPDEVDISSHTYASAYVPKESDVSVEDEVRRLLRGPTGNNPPHSNSDGSLLGAGVGNDSFPRILQHLVGSSMATDEGRREQRCSGDQSGLPQGLAAMLGAVGATGPEEGPSYEEKQSNNKFGYVWRITHALFALALGICMVSMTPFNGAQFSRWEDSEATRAELGVRFFWAFATAQLILQSTRYFLEGDQGPVRGEGWMGMVAGAFPEPWRRRTLLLSRYSLICSTVVQDAMVVIFVLGCVTWWEGAVA